MRTGGLLLSVLSLCACAPEAQLPTPSPKEHLRTTAERAETEPDQERCVAEGGSVEHRGMFGSPMCVKPYPDAGRVCTDSSQCSGACLAESEPGILSVESGATGQCQADSAAFGCFGEVQQGRIDGFLCVD